MRWKISGMCWHWMAIRYFPTIVCAIWWILCSILCIFRFITKPVMLLCMDLAYCSLGLCVTRRVPKKRCFPNLSVQEAACQTMHVHLFKQQCMCMGAVFSVGRVCWMYRLTLPVLPMRFRKMQFWVMICWKEHAYGVCTFRSFRWWIQHRRHRNLFSNVVNDGTEEMYKPFYLPVLRIKMQQESVSAALCLWPCDFVSLKMCFVCCIRYVCLAVYFCMRIPLCRCRFCYVFLLRFFCSVC